MAKEIGMIYGFIAVRLLLLYLSTTMSSNIMTQIYTERVLINGEEPPVLYYQIILFLAIDLVLNILLMGVIHGIATATDGGNILEKYGMQYVVSLILITVLSMLVSNTMYRKKYFLYKDDGLRAVRALSEIVFRLGCLISVVPFFLAAGDKDCSSSNAASAAKATSTAEVSALKEKLAVATKNAQVLRENRNSQRR